MDVQKYIKRLKFARADMSRNTGPFETRDEAINFLNQREFFFGDPFVVKYKDREDGDKVKLLLAIGKVDEPVPEGDQVFGATGEDAYELFDNSAIMDLIEELREELEAVAEQTSANTEAIEQLIDQIAEMSGATENLEEIVGSGWTDSPTNITLTDRIKRDEQLMKIVWEYNHNDSGVYDGRINGIPFELVYDETHNTLAVAVGEGDDRIVSEPIQLGGGVEVFTKIEYVQEDEALRFCYKPGRNPDADEECFEVPIGDLINEWTVENTNTVELNKERVISGQDVLTANVKISDDADNMLVAKEDGLYVSDSAITSVSEVVDKLKEDLGTLEDGHLPTDYFSGDTINGSSNIQDALLKLDEAVVGLNSGVDELRNDLENTANTLNQKIDDEIAAREELAENVDALNSGLTELAETVDEGQEVAARALNVLAEGIVGIRVRKLSEEECRELGDDVLAAYVLSNNGVESEPIIVYKDKDQDIWVDEIYFGHTDDILEGAGEDGWSQTNRIVSGTATPMVIRFILTRNTDGWYKLSDKYGELNLEAIVERIETLETAFNESEEVNARALNVLAEAIMGLGQQMYTVSSDLEDLTDAFNESEEVTARALNFLAEYIMDLAYQVQENTERIEEVDEKVGEGFFGGGFSVDITQRIRDIESNIIGRHYPGAPWDNTYVMVGDHRELRPILPYANGTNIEGQINGLNQALVGISGTTSELSDLVEDIRRIDDSFELALDTDMAVISFNWTDENGNPRSSSINVSDFTKDSFLQDVEVVRVDGVEYLKFTWITHDPEHDNPPLEILVPLSDFATIYHAGAGIDPDELENNQIITVKIDPMHEGENSFLAKEPSGLRVTGVTEAIEEAVAAEAQARQEEDERLWEALNNEISARTEADNELQEEIDDIMSSLSAFTADTIVVNDLTAVTANIENLYAENAEIDNLTAHTIYADEYQNLPTATTEQYGVVILDDHLDSASTRVVMNSAITKTILENEETTAAALNDLNNRKANRSELEAVENDLHNNYYNKAEVDELFDEFEITVDDHLDSASTNPVENRVLYRIIVDDEEAIAAALNDLNDRKADITYVDAGDQNLQEQIDGIIAGGLTNVRTEGSGNVVTAVTRSNNDVVAHLGTVDTSNISAQTINTSAFTATTANISNLTANTIVTNEITATTANIENLTAQTIVTDEITANTANFTGVTANTLDVDNITAQTILTNTITGNTANFTGMTATTISATTYNNLPTASTTNYGMVILDDHLDSGSTHAVMNSAITQTIIENEEITAAALNDLNDRINNIRFDVDDHLDSASTNPVENKVLYQIIVDDEEAIAAALNDLNDRKADQTDVTNIENRVTVVEDAIEVLSGGGLTGVTTTGSGNVVVGISKVGQTVQATLGNVDVTNKVDTTVFNTFTASTLNDVTTAGTGTIVTNVEKDGTNVKVTKTNQLNLSNLTANTLNATGITATTEVVNNLTANTINATGVTATTVSATTYNNLPTASTTNYGVVIMDDHLDTGSTHAVMNSAITQTIIQNELITAAALNDLNDRKANVEDIPVTINDLDGAGDLALKTDLAGFLPLSGGTMTGNISGETGCSIFMPGGFFQQSDETLKIFMGDVENALEKANKIPTKYFYWKDRYDGPRELGTSAQKVQEVFPEIVSGGDKLSVDYSKLAIVALAAIKELTAKVEDLQNQLDELKK